MCCNLRIAQLTAQVPFGWAFHEELSDQFVFLGTIPMGLYTIRTDPGTPLNWMRDAVRGVMGQVIAVSTPVVVQLLEAVGWIKQ